MCRVDTQKVTTKNNTISNNINNNTINDDIIIRHFESKDLDQVHKLFVKGMMPLSWEATKANVISILKNIFHWKHPLILPLPILAIGIQFKQQQQQQQQMQQHFHNTNIMNGLSYYYYFGSAILVFCILSIKSYLMDKKAFLDYIQYSINTDLSSIPSVYQTNTNGGCFLVAINKQNNEILGMVAGEYKRNDDNNGRRKNKIFELRRMSVDEKARGRGLGKRLIQQLEEELNKDDDLSCIYLTTSSVQYAANKLYMGQGFQLIKESPYPNSSFTLRDYEKNY